jgi:hypothetical protein
MYKTKIFTDNACYAQNFDNEDSPYFKKSQRLRNFVNKRVKALKKDPEKVAIVIEKIIMQKKSKFRNIPDFESKIQYFLRRILPFSLYCKIIEKAFKQI